LKNITFLSNEAPKTQILDPQSLEACAIDMFAHSYNWPYSSSLESIITWTKIYYLIN